MGAEELRMKTEDQLKTDLASLKKEAFNLRFQQANGQLENTARVRVVRRDIARIMTFLGQKAAAAASSAPKPAAQAKPAKAKKAAKPQADEVGAEAAEKKAARKPKTETPKAKKAAAKKTAKAKA